MLVSTFNIKWTHFDKYISEIGMTTFRFKISCVTNSPTLIWTLASILCIDKYKIHTQKLSFTLFCPYSVKDFLRVAQIQRRKILNTIMRDIRTIDDKRIEVPTYKNKHSSSFARFFRNLY